MNAMTPYEWAASKMKLFESHGNPVGLWIALTNSGAIRVEAESLFSGSDIKEAIAMLRLFMRVGAPRSAAQMPQA